MIIVALADPTHALWAVPRSFRFVLNTLSRSSVNNLCLILHSDHAASCVKSSPQTIQGNFRARISTACLFLLIAGCGDKAKDLYDTAQLMQIFPLANFHRWVIASSRSQLTIREGRTSTCKVVRIEEIFSRRVFSSPAPRG